MYPERVDLVRWGCGVQRDVCAARGSVELRGRKRDPDGDVLCHHSERGNQVER